MADKKISELSLGTPVSTDVFPFVDLSTGTTKKVTFGSIILSLATEIPSGSTDESNTVFTVLYPPLWITVDGQTMVNGDGYTLSNSNTTVTFTTAPRAGASLHSFFTNPISQPDIVPPTAPTSLTATAISSSQINLSWTAATDNIGVAGYKIYRAGVLIGTTSIATTYSDAGLASSTTFSYYVTAIDSASNESAISNTASATTQAPPSGGSPTPRSRKQSTLRVSVGNIIAWKGR